ncbi:hypothetical protein [Thiohalocapsa sp.]|jgi:hypothetical protein|uniref:hypothetical protein n=1 Tax=Thiohalocapsa sp. TaxID=2497641 RepID=UPI0025D89D2A|nr:hypothetical protein [Thiohalocapsa sp.]
MRLERFVYAGLWLALVGYWLFFSPPPPADFLGEVTALAMADTGRVDPIAIAVFNLLGVLPTAFLAILLFDPGRPASPVTPWPFAIGAYFLGGIILLPYLVLRNAEAPLRGAPNAFVQAIGSRVAGWILLAIGLGLVGFAVVAGSAAAFAQQFADSQFIAVMSADLIALTTALHLASGTDRRRRGLGQAPGWQHVPLFGPLLYLATRPRRTD